MRQLRRLTALFVNLLLVQLLLVGTGTACATEGSESLAAPAMAMAGDRMAPGHEVASRDAQGADCGADACHVPCGIPSSSGAGCAQMPNCAAAMTVEPIATLVTSPRAVQLFPAPVVAPSGPATHPDVPPPRA